MNLLAVAHNYISQNKKIILMKPSVDTRLLETSKSIEDVTSRTGVTMKAHVIIKDVESLNEGYLNNMKDAVCVLVDEAQFLKKEEIDLLRNISHEIPVICYGLKTDFKTNLFEGSKRLLEVADSIEEIKTICSMSNCNKKAIYSFKIKKISKGNLNTIDENDSEESYQQIDLGGNEKYIPVCAIHYANYDL
jgi:thymidine kinase